MIVSDEQTAKINLEPEPYHGDWCFPPAFLTYL